jgi:hypothetical protein
MLAFQGLNSRRYAWDLSGFLRSGGKLEQVLEAFQESYAPLLRERPRAVRKAAPESASATFCKVR